jgi:uncharacterized protein (TIGR03435 family)
MPKFTTLGAFWIVLTMAALAPETPAVAGARPPATEAAPEKAVFTYEIVSIKPNKDPSGGGGIKGLPDGRAWTNMTLSRFIFDAYGIIMDRQVVGLPEWANWENYDIIAKVDAKTAERWEKLSDKERWEEEQPRMRSILADRFRLKTHQATKELPVYDLVIAKGGLKIKQALPDEKPMERLSLGEMTVRAVPIDTIANVFPNAVGRIIVDKTGLGEKKFDFELKWTDERRLADDEAPSLMTAFEEQLGVKLVPSKAPVKVLMIDHLERPSPN